jgi:hypothetical protein
LRAELERRRIMARVSWQPGTFSIATSQGTKIVDGIVSGPFGIRVEEGRQPVFSVTHLPSGARATTGGAGFVNLEMARAFVERLMELTDWSRMDETSPHDSLGPKVAAIWNELIALDTAKTIANHYAPTVARGMRAGKR